MVRLVDTDALISFLVKAGRFVKAQDDKRTAAHAIGKIIEHVEKMPTIDAIPVEWLQKQFYDNPNSQWAEKCRDVFTGWQKWQSMQKEQEAR